MEGGVFDVQKAAFPLITGIGEFAVHGERLEGGLLAREDRDARIAFLDLRGQPFGIPASGLRCSSAICAGSALVS